MKNDGHHDKPARGVPAPVQAPGPQHRELTMTRYLLAWIALTCCSLFPAQDLGQARRVFRDASKKESVQDREPGIAALIACGDPRALGDILDELVKTAKGRDQLDRRASALGDKAGEAFEAVDRQSDKGRPISAGTYESAEAKVRELRKEMATVLAQRDVHDAWTDRLTSGAGRFLDALEDANRFSAVDEACKRVRRSRDHEERVLLLRAIAASRHRSTQDGLISLFAGEEDGGMRTAIVDALGARRSPDLVPLLASALDDEVWPVRVSAARALAQVPSVNAIPPLLASVSRTEGRTLEEILEALTAISGRTFLDNVTLWEAWWKDEQTVLAELESNLGDAAHRTRAILDVGERGFLLGARRLLADAGLGVDVGAFPAPPAGSGSAEETELAIDAVGSAFTRVPLNYQDRMVERFLLVPLLRTKDVEDRLRFIAYFGGVRTPTVRQRLMRWAGSEPVASIETGSPLPEDRRRSLRSVALRALGRQGTDEVVLALHQALTGYGVEPEVRVAAVDGLARLARKACVPTLIAGLKNREPEVRAAVRGALTGLCEQDFEEDEARWQRWWDSAKAGFTPKGEAAEVVAATEHDRSGTRFYGIETRSKHMVFILDRSGSMQEPDSKGDGTKMAVAKKELIRVVQSLPNDATFNIIFYNSGWETWQDSMTQSTAESRKKAVAWIERLEEMGATNIFDPLAHAFKLAGRGSHDRAYRLALDTIFFLSDGLANRGRIIESPRILQEVADMNALKKVKIHTIGIGAHHDVALMKGLADLTGGTYVAR